VSRDLIYVRSKTVYVSGNGSSSSTRGKNPHGQKYIYFLHKRTCLWYVTNAGLLATVSKGQRVIIITIYQRKWLHYRCFVNVKIGEKSGDYSQEINCHKCRRWPKTKLITNFPQNPVLVVENEAYHDEQLNLTSTSSARKSSMIDCVSDRNIFSVTNM
jgi:hypothetical protein